MDNNQIIALVIFVITYLGIIFTRLPRVNIDRPSAAFFGAIAMILFGVVTFEDAISSIDFHTIALLLGMMIIVSSLQQDGFFHLLTQKAISVSKNPSGLLTVLVFTTGFGSAFLVNDAVVLIVTPITIGICVSSGIRPLPFLIAVILASNAGSVMTMTGNPQNMLIGINSGMSYGRFFLHLLPVSLVSMAIVIMVIRVLYAKDFKTNGELQAADDISNVKPRQMIVSVSVFAGVMVLFFMGSFLNISIPMIALLGGSVILLFGKSRPSLILAGVDWVLLLFFSGLFIVIHAVEHAGLLAGLSSINVTDISFAGNMAIHGAGLLASQIVSNVPYVIAMLPFVKPIDSEALWLILSSSSTLAGNATIVGAIANLIVIETAAKMNVKITFVQFLKAGLISTVLSLFVSVLILQLQIALGLLS